VKVVGGRGESMEWNVDKFVGMGGGMDHGVQDNNNNNNTKFLKLRNAVGWLQKRWRNGSSS